MWLKADLTCQVERFDAPFVPKPCHAPIMSQNFIKLGNISNIVRYMYGINHQMTESTSYKQKGGRKIGYIVRQRGVTVVPVLEVRVEQPFPRIPPSV